MIALADGVSAMALFIGMVIGTLTSVKFILGAR